MRARSRERVGALLRVGERRYEARGGGRKHRNIVGAWRCPSAPWEREAGEKRGERAPGCTQCTVSQREKEEGAVQATSPTASRSQRAPAPRSLAAGPSPAKAEAQ